MMSKTKIRKRLKKKKNSYIVDTVFAAEKHPEWRKISQIISGPNKKYSSVNLKIIEQKTSAGDTIIIPGKVLGTGEVTKKLRVCALDFSETSKEKLEKNNGEVVTILEEIKKNPKASGIKIIK